MSGTTPDQFQRIAQQAADVPRFGRRCFRRIAQPLVAVADALVEAQPELVATAMHETGLTEARLVGRLKSTADACSSVAGPPVSRSPPPCSTAGHGLCPPTTAGRRWHRGHQQVPAPGQLPGRPEEMLSLPVRDDNPWRVPQRRSQAGESRLWGAYPTGPVTPPLPEAMAGVWGGRGARALRRDAVTGSWSRPGLREGKALTFCPSPARWLQ
jgi:hypothetical protein